MERSMLADRPLVRIGLVVVVGLAAAADGEDAAENEREVVGGITTTRLIQGEPYDLAGRRLVFLNWHYIRPGVDADWVKPGGKSARVAGAAGPFEARFRSVDHARGIRLVAQPAEHVGPLLDLERPWERKGIRFGTVIHEGGRYRAWGSCDASAPDEPPSIRFCYFESEDDLRGPVSNPRHLARRRRSRPPRGRPDRASLPHGEGEALWPGV